MSHDQHVDNLDPAGRAYLPQAKQVLTTLAGAQRLDGGTRGVATWETVDLQGADGLPVHVTATPARHGPPELEEVMGEVTGWIIEWEGQRRGAIYVSGDTVLFEELQEIPQWQLHTTRNKRQLALITQLYGLMTSLVPSLAEIGEIRFCHVMETTASLGRRPQYT